MSDNPYASPRAYGERRRFDWDRVYQAWFFFATTTALVCGVGACLAGHALRGVGFECYWVEPVSWWSILVAATAFIPANLAKVKK